MRAWLALLSLSGLAAAPTLAITAGQVDAFQDGSTQNWGGNSSPINMADGGPDGAGDRFLQLSANNFHLGARNQVQWTGDYLAAGVDELVFDLNNFGPAPVAVRITIFGPGGAFTSTNEVALGSGWVSASFSLNEADLTRTDGIGTLDQTLAGVTNLLLRHDPDPISPPGEANLVTASIGVDNVTALPEPGISLMLAAALPALASLARAKGSRGEV